MRTAYGIDTKVRELMTLDYRSRWIGRWFYPNNIARFWFTKFDRTDIMAQTLADKMFDKPITGFDLSLGELNPLRPNLILNATTGIDDGAHPASVSARFSPLQRRILTVSAHPLRTIPLARAVMATAAFPGSV